MPGSTPCMPARGISFESSVEDSLCKTPGTGRMATAATTQYILPSGPTSTSVKANDPRCWR